MVQQLSTNTFGCAKWIVSTDATQGTHTTISSALTSASSGDTIFIRPGTYTENPTLKAGVNLAAYVCDGFTPNVIINGECTLTAAGTVSISGVQFQTNSNFCISVTGSNAIVLNINSCYINCSNNTGINLSNSSTSTFINISNCIGNLGTTGIGLYSITGDSNLTFFNCNIGNSGASTTASNCSTGVASFYWCNIPVPISASGTGTIGFINGNIDTSAHNTTPLTLTGTSSMTFQNASCSAGTASAFSIASGCTANVYNSLIGSSNTNAISGAGSILYSALSFSSSSDTIQSTLSQTGGPLQGSKNTAPSAGFLGEQIRANGNASISNNTYTSLCSISLTAGIWDVSAVTVFQFTGLATFNQLGISTSNTGVVGTFGDQYIQTNVGGLTAPNTSLAIPSFRLTLTATTTYYCTVLADFSTGTCTGYGRISATRVG